jgi:hypothetical protein
VTVAAPCSVSGILVIDGINLSTGPAFYTPDLLDLWGTGFDTRGKDRVVPGRVGVMAYRRRPTVSQHSVGLIISGYDAWDGTPRISTMLNLEANIARLRDNLVLPPGTAQGVRSAVLTMPSGAVRSGPVHVLKLDLGKVSAGWLLATLAVSIPGGLLS